jgi:hypothetical protein
VSHPRYTSEEIARRGQALYEERLRAKVDPRDRGKFLVLDIETGEHELDVDELAALRRAKRKNADAVLYILRIGYPVAYRIGRSFGRPLAGEQAARPRRELARVIGSFSP